MTCRLWKFKITTTLQSYELLDVMFGLDSGHHKDKMSLRSASSNKGGENGHQICAEIYPCPPEKYEALVISLGQFLCRRVSLIQKTKS